MSLKPGDVILNRYRIEAPLGEGGMGAVYRAFDTLHDRPCALKEFQLGYLPTEDETRLHADEDATRLRGGKTPPATREKAAEQFKREARLLAKLDHPNLPKVTDYFNIGDDHYLVMNLIEGQSLAALPECVNGRPIPEKQVLAWMEQVMAALEYCHAQGVIHRDVKPANIILTPEGKVYLVDFGIAKPAEPGRKTTMGARGTTPGYSPPEQYAGQGRTDARSDIYALGATMYDLLTGQEPLDAIERVEKELPSPRRLVSSISPAVEAAIMRALALKREERFQSMAEFRQSLLPRRAQPQPTQPAPLQPQASDFRPPTSEIVLTLPPGVEMVLVRIPAGEFLMGSSDKDQAAFDDEKPQHTVRLDEYWMGKYPVTVAQFAAFVQATGYKTTAEKQGSGWTWTGSGLQEVRGANWQHPRGPGSDVAQKANHPVTQVSWDDAVAFCQWASRVTGRTVRLPTEAEWEKAARGADGRLWPWGDEPPDNTRCNFGMQVGDTTPVGQYPPGDSPYHCADMAGNVWEWTGSLYKGYPYQSGDGRENPNDRGSRVLRGGAFHYYRGVVRCAFRDGYLPYDRYDDAGFRVVCASPIFPISGL